jgi:hypothetical protein
MFLSEGSRQKPESSILFFGHVKAEMRMKYGQVAGEDLQGEFLLARSQPRHLVPQPTKRQRCRRVQGWMVLPMPYCSPNTPSRCSGGPQTARPRRRLDRLSNRLTKILSEARKLNNAG